METLYFLTVLCAATFLVMPTCGGEYNIIIINNNYICTVSIIIIMVYFKLQLLFFHAVPQDLLGVPTVHMNYKNTVV